MGSLSISLHLWSVVVNKFVNGEFPRSQVMPSTVEYSSSGLALISGRNHKPKYNWNVSAYLNSVQLQTLWIIWENSDSNRRSFVGNEFAISLVDTTEPNPFTAFVIIPERPKATKMGRFFATSFVMEQL